MQVLKKVIQDAGEIHAWFPPELQTGFLFLPDVVHLSVGEELCLWLFFPQYRAELYILGMGAWRRPRSGSQARTLPAGTGLALKPGQANELSFLGKMLTGDAEPLPQRLYHRTRILEPWGCQIVVPHLGTWTPASLIEISEGGARVVIGVMPVHEGCQIQIGMPWHSTTNHVMSLAWFKHHGGEVSLGLSRAQEGGIPAQEWDLLVDYANRHFRSFVKDL